MGKQAQMNNQNFKTDQQKHHIMSKRRKPTRFTGKKKSKPTHLQKYMPFDLRIVLKK